MLVRVVRGFLSTLLLLIGLPLLLAGGLLWAVGQHQAETGGYAADMSTVTSDGHAVVVADVDDLLRRDTPFARAGRTTLALTAHTGSGPAFLGLAPAAEVGDYLAGVPHTRVDEVRLARGPLPVTTAPVPGETPPPGPPTAQSFWVADTGDGELRWQPHEFRGRDLALVVMDPAGEAPLTVDVTARVQPGWLGSTTYGLLVLGTLLSLLAVVVLIWPGRSREIVYVVPPTHMPEIAAHLGVPVPGGEPDRRSAAGGGEPAGPWAGSRTPGSVTVADIGSDDRPTVVDVGPGQPVGVDVGRPAVTDVGRPAVTDVGSDDQPTVVVCGPDDRPAVTDAVIGAGGADHAGAGEAGDAGAAAAPEDAGDAGAEAGAASGVGAGPEVVTAPEPAGEAGVAGETGAVGEGGPGHCEPVDTSSGPLRARLEWPPRDAERTTADPAPASRR